MVREVNLARLESRRAGYCFEIQQSTFQQFNTIASSSEKPLQSFLSDRFRRFGLAIKNMSVNQGSWGGTVSLNASNET